MVEIKQKIVPHLWFDKEAKEAADFYCSIFPNSKIINIGTLHDTPSGDSDVVSFKLWGYSFMAISAGPVFKFNPSISFMINFDPSLNEDAETMIDEVWARLSEGGHALMPLDAYPFSKRYGWIQDKYGVNWQLILTNPEGEPRPLVIPSLMFTGDRTGQAGDAIDFYVSVFKDARRGITAPYPPGGAPEEDAKIMFADFMLQGQWFTAMDSGHMHDFSFNEAISFMVNCDDQNEIDYYWGKLSAVPEAEQCGWLKDKYGISWQIVPTIMEKMMQNQDPETLNRVTQAFLKMKKLDIDELVKAYEGN
ncbi:MAG: VOC family protein [Rubrobacteridae bacterium]|nr:VOC family protein [Rubrobacteridae bacterium]